ncbi:MAG TPA: amidohydrolase family protein [Streptosporangiaceae bacterium]|nr:amidohydrolase family protein [Streptosporangiaceae bacterium]
MSTVRAHPVVDVHIHYLPPALLKVFARRTRPPRAERQDGWLVLDFGEGYVERIDARLVEPEYVFENLRRAGVDVAVVSINQPGVLRLEAPEAKAVARDANDELAELVGKGEGAIEGLATLPWQATDAAVEELTRAASLGLKGAMVCSNVAGRPLDDPAFDATFGAAASLSMPLLLHPTVPAEVSALSEHGLICAAGFLFDTTTAILRMIFAGTFERHPGLKMILAHSGSLLPLLMGRVDREYTRNALPCTLPEGRRPSDYLRSLHTDTIAGSPGALKLAIELLGADRVCFGSDYPFGNQQQALDLVLAAALPDQVVSAVCGENAAELFGLKLIPAAGAEGQESAKQAP